MSEDKILSECHKWLWNTYPETRYLCWHVANERKQSPMQGAIMKAKGVLSGVPDFVINWKGKTLYIEFKISTGKQTESQKMIQKALESQSFEYHIIRNIEEFKKLIEKTI
jgi:hypothetical protein